MKSATALNALMGLLLCSCAAAWAQSIGGGTVTGTVTDPSKMLVPNAQAQLRNTTTGYSQSAATDSAGGFRFNNVPPNMYELAISAPGFESRKEQVEVRGPVPINLDIELKMGEVTTSIDVAATGALIDTDPSAHTDADASAFSKLPRFDPAAGLSSIINNSTGGTASDANGFFHPLGDHAQVSFVIDGQPINDQQSKVFSTQLPPNAIQSMQLITGAPDAQYGDKSSLVVNATTMSGLGSAQPFGSVEAYGGSFGTWGENATLGYGTAKFGNFIALNGVRTGHFLDTPEYTPFHDIGNNETLFDRLDYQPDGRSAYHLNLFAARNWFQVPNSYDQLGQDQKQRVLTWNVAPGYQHTFNSSSLLTINTFVRHDQVNYYGSRNPLNDTPATVEQLRFLMNWGAKADYSMVHKNHSFKFGTQLQQTRLNENFNLGITDPRFNPVCFGAGGQALLLPGVTDPSVCSSVNPAYYGNPNFRPGLAPYDLTRGGSMFGFHGLGNINQYAFYATDTIRLGEFTLDIGLRDDEYQGLTSKNGVQPRAGLSYRIARSDTVIRAAYSRTFETPFNENLLLSSATGSGGLAENIFGAEGSVPIAPGMRNQFNAGLQQRLGKYIVFDGDYFWKYTHNAYDFDVLFNTPITFPIAWHNSKIDGLTGRVSTTRFHGMQMYTTFGHSRARYFPPEVGGLIFQGTASIPGVFRIDHDQAFQQTTNLRYQHGTDGLWGALIWRYDSGLVVTGVPSASEALLLTPAQQVTIGLFCNGVAATYATPITACSGNLKSTLLTLPTASTANNDHNPDRVRSRNLLDLALGTDNLLRSETRRKVALRFTITNVTNAVALYNFLSTFSGTHFVAPRTYQMLLAYRF
jgi:hypothetical protein